MQNENVEIVCPTLTIDYNCSFQAYNQALSLMWQITDIKEETDVTIIYNENQTFTVNSIQDFGNGIQASVTKYRPNEYIESILSLVFPHGSQGATVHCEVGTMLPSQLNITVYKGTLQS